VTAITKTRSDTAPPLTRAGLALPGLGHLLVGEWVSGLGLFLLDGVLVAAAVTGFPRVSEVLFGGPADGASLHGVLALVAWPLLAGALWFTAYRRAFPRKLSDEEFNSNREIFLRTLTRHRTGMLGFFGVAFILLVTLLTPLLAPFDPDIVDVGAKNLPPGGAFYLGTDGFGRDVYSRLLFGGRISLSIGFMAVTIAATLGTTIGALAAFAGGMVDRSLMFVTDGLLALPKLVLLLTIVGLFRVQGVWGIFLIIAILAFTGWMGVSRIVRSQVLSLKQQEFVQAAQALGLSSTRILFRHLIPNALAPVIVYCSLAIGSTMLAEAGLSFLGLGVPPPTSTWGVMVADGKDALRNAPHVAIFPGLAIMWSVLSFNLLGDGLRDALDPKLRGH
jgi:peptide/nickel transport system permease protein